MTFTRLARYVQVGITLEAHGTIPLVSPFAWKAPPLFPNPFYLLGIPPLRVVQFPSTLVPGCLCTDLPPPFPPRPSSLSPAVPHFNMCPPSDNITKSASHSPIHPLLIQNYMNKLDFEKGSKLLQPDAVYRYVAVQHHLFE
jgi:hypothetical protein